MDDLARIEPFEKCCIGKNYFFSKWVLFYENRYKLYSIFRKYILLFRTTKVLLHNQKSYELLLSVKQVYALLVILPTKL